MSSKKQKISTLHKGIVHKLCGKAKKKTDKGTERDGKVNAGCRLSRKGEKEWKITAEAIWPVKRGRDSSGIWQEFTKKCG